MESFEPAVRATVSRLFGCPGDALRFEMLAAHASSRTYWRVHLRSPEVPPEVSPEASRAARADSDSAARADSNSAARADKIHGVEPRTLALMVLHREDRGIKSDEIVEIESTITELPFVNVHRFLRSFTDAVPEIYFLDEANGLIYLEDLGDTLFESVVADASDDARRAWYGRALDLLVTLQTEGTRRLDERCIASKASFTETLFLWEFEHFIAYGLGTKFGRDVDPGLLALLREAFAPVARRLCSEPRVFTHRDFQSRNLLVQPEVPPEVSRAARADSDGAARVDSDNAARADSDGEARADKIRCTRLRLIDFQDALLGPRTYDLVALLRDSYVELPPALVETLVDDYLARAAAGGFHAGRDAFREAFARMTLQRKLKDYGRFVYIDRVKGNPGFLRHNPVNARYILDAAEQLPELGAARAILADALGPVAGRRA